MFKKKIVGALAISTIGFGLVLSNLSHAAQDTVKVGLIFSMTGPFASTGKQLEEGARLFVAQHGDTVAGKKIELVIKDDGGVSENTRRIAQELVVQDKVDVIGGFTLTPLAIAASQVATQSKTPTIVMVAATSSVINASPYFVRSSFTLPQVTKGVAEWAPRSGYKNVVTLVSDYGPGIDSEKAFVSFFKGAGGNIIDSIRVPMQNPDFAPFLQRVKDLQPDAVFVFLPAGVGTQFMKQFTDRGLADAGIQLLATGDVVEDDILEGMGESTLGVVSSHHYSAAHPSEKNQEFVKAFKEAYNNRRPNYMAVAAYDGMSLLYNALEQTSGEVGDALLDAMKGQEFESPRGKVRIDKNTRDIVQDVYIRKVELQDGELYNVEFDVIKEVEDPVGL